jgi:ABC-type multidrug transport system fused ATPase/permease subunit
MIKENKQNLIIYTIFLFVVLIGIYYGNAFYANHKFIRIWNLTNILLLLIGIPFLFFQTKAKLPNFWQKDISFKYRFLLPIVIGIIFGALDVLVFKVILHPEPYQELPPFLQPFPYSIFLYFSGAFEVELFYRLIPLTLILLIGNWFKQGKYYMFFFWASAILTAIREPLEQLPQGGILLIVYALLTGFLMNLFQAIWYKKAGFLASLSLRLGHYLIWHILLGIYIEYFEMIK